MPLITYKIAKINVCVSDQLHCRRTRAHAHVTSIQLIKESLKAWQANDILVASLPEECFVLRTSPRSERCLF